MNENRVREPNAASKKRAAKSAQTTRGFFPAEESANRDQVISTGNSSKNAYSDYVKSTTITTERHDVLTFDGEAEKKLIKLLQGLSDWYPKAPRLPGNQAVLVRLEETLPDLFEAIGQLSPIELPEKGKLPTELPKWEARSGKEGFYYDGESFLFKGSDHYGKPVEQQIECGDILPFTRFQGIRAEGEQPDAFLLRNWQPWLDAKLLTQSVMRRQTKGSTGLDKALYDALYGVARAKGDHVARWLPSKWVSNQKKEEEVLGPLDEDTGSYVLRTAMRARRKY